MLDRWFFGTGAAFLLILTAGYGHSIWHAARVRGLDLHSAIQADALFFAQAGLFAISAWLVLGAIFWLTGVGRRA